MATHFVFSAFQNMPYPCFFLPKQGALLCNDACADASLPFSDPSIMLSILQTASAEHFKGNKSSSFSLPLLTDVLDLRVLTLIPLEEGLLAVAQDEHQTSVQVFSGHIREYLTNIFSSLASLSTHVESENILYLDSIQLNCYQLLRMITNLENSAQLESKKLRMDVLDFSSFIDDLCTQVSTACRNIPVSITWSVPPTPLFIEANANLLSAAILNILRNSLQFTKDDNKIHLNLQEVNKKAVLSISDTGLGISEHHLTHIFEPYYSVNPYGDTNERPGVGLGLASARETFIRFGGFITAESRFGSGTTLHLSLPLCEDEPPFAESNTSTYQTRHSAFSPINIHLVGFIPPPYLL